MKEGQPCKACQAASTNQVSGLYQMHCLRCNARLVASARPSRQHQELMLEAIARARSPHGRAEILACVSHIPEKHR